MDCKFCKNTFSSKFVLETHIKSAKYCLKIQGNKAENIYQYRCLSCDKQLSSKRRLNTHHLSCVEYIIDKLKEDYKIKLSEKDIQIQILQDKLENIALKAVSKPINIHQTNNNQKINTMINNLIPITDKHFEDNAKYLTIEHIKRGAEGYVEYALEFPLKNRVACVDYSRKKIKYKEEGKEGQEIIICDPGMSKLSTKLFSAINDRNIGLISKHTNELTQLMFSEPDKERETNELSDKDVEKSIKSGEIIVGNIFQLRSQVFDVRESAKGSKTDLYHRLVNKVCSKTAY
jgi:hypothetical protein